MPFPPPTLPTTRANATPQINTHPNDHNQVNQAVNDTVAEVHAVRARLGALEPRVDYVYSAPPLHTGVIYTGGNVTGNAVGTLLVAAVDGSGLFVSSPPSGVYLTRNALVGGTLQCDWYSAAAGYSQVTIVVNGVPFYTWKEPNTSGFPGSGEQSATIGFVRWLAAGALITIDVARGGTTGTLNSASLDLIEARPS